MEPLWEKRRGNWIEEERQDKTRQEKERMLTIETIRTYAYNDTTIEEDKLSSSLHRPKALLTSETKSIMSASNSGYMRL